MSKITNLYTPVVIPPGTYVETLTGNDGIVVPADLSGNINVVGTGNIFVTGNAGTHTETIALVGTTNHAVQVGNAAGSISSIPVGTTGQVLTGVTGSDPVFAAISTLGVVTTLHTQDGNNVTPTAGVINISGGNNLTTTGTVGPNTVTVSLTGITQHSLQVGGAAEALTQLGVATDGQLPIGSTGADPVLATLTAGTGISITNGAGSITIASTGTSTLAYTAVNTSPYVVLTTDEFLSVDSSGGAITIELPNAPSTGRAFVIKDRTGSANTNAITVTTVGGAVNIDGATTYVMNTQYASVDVLFGSSTYQIF
jgi:hypothetical protein